MIERRRKESHDTYKQRKLLGKNVNIQIIVIYHILHCRYLIFLNGVCNICLFLSRTQTISSFLLDVCVHALACKRVCGGRGRVRVAVTKPTAPRFCRLLCRYGVWVVWENQLVGKTDGKHLNKRFIDLCQQEWRAIMSTEKK